MAGQSKRFFIQGFTEKKFKLTAGNKSLFYRAVIPFTKYNDLISEYIFIILEKDQCKNWLNQQIESMKISNYQIITLDENTGGQAETAYLGLSKSSIKENSQIFIMNIDTILHEPNIRELSTLLKQCSGVIDVAKLSGNNWSFVTTAEDDTTRVLSFVEKIRVSNLASTGLYGFGSAKIFMDSFEEFRSVDSNLSEIYLSIVYQHMIANGITVRCQDNPGSISFSGTPEEYVTYCKENLWTPDKPVAIK